MKTATYQTVTEHDFERPTHPPQAATVPINAAAAEVCGPSGQVVSTGEYRGHPQAATTIVSIKKYFKDTCQAYI